MSKITFRADDDLVNAVEDLDESKSEVMRDALRAYLDERASDAPAESLDEVVAERVDELVDRRLGARRPPAQDVNIRLTVDTPNDGRADAERASTERAPRGGREQPSREQPSGGQSCAQCGATLDDDHVYCPNCGEKATNRVFCECGDEIRADWAFCPHCGRRTASADALDR